MTKPLNTMRYTEHAVPTTRQGWETLSVHAASDLAQLYPAKVLHQAEHFYDLPLADHVFAATRIQVSMLRPRNATLDSVVARYYKRTDDVAVGVMGAVALVIAEFEPNTFIRNAAPFSRLPNAAAIFQDFATHHPDVFLDHRKQFKKLPLFRDRDLSQDLYEIAQGWKQGPSHEIRTWEPDGRVHEYKPREMQSPSGTQPSVRLSSCSVSPSQGGRS